MLFFDVKVHNGAACIHPNNFEPGGIGDAKDFTHFINKFSGAIFSKEITDLLVETDGGLYTVDEGHSESAIGSQNILNILIVVDVFVAATFLFAGTGFSFVVSQNDWLFVNIVCFYAD